MPQPLIVLDTNSLIMAISSKSHYHKVWQSFLNGDYILCISNEIIEEYLEVIARNINAKVAEAVIYAILTRKNVHRLAPTTDSASFRMTKMTTSLWIAP